MPRIVRVGLAQVVTPPSAPEDPEGLVRACVDIHLGLLEQAAALGVQVLCFRELAFYPWFPLQDGERWAELAEPIPGGANLELLRERAREARMVLALPTYERSSSGSLYSTTVLLDEKGEVAGTYRKVHVPAGRGWRAERPHYRPGNKGFPVFRTRYGSIGIYMGNDLLFPEGARVMALSSADILLAPGAWPEGPAHATLAELPAFHACTNGCYVAACNRAGADPLAPATVFGGRSRIWSPRGTVLAQASRGHSELVWADLDLGKLEEVRLELGLLRDRQPTAYQRLVRPSPLEDRLKTLVPGKPRA